MRTGKITIEQVIDAFVNIPLGTEFTRSEIVTLVTNLYGNMEIIPSDYCYNRVNNGIDIKKNIADHRCLFEYLGYNRYKYIGIGKSYSGNLYPKPQGEAERIVGKINNSIVEEYK